MTRMKFCFLFLFYREEIDAEKLFVILSHEISNVNVEKVIREDSSRKKKKKNSETFLTAKS